jgi:hypothetical protein
MYHFELQHVAGKTFAIADSLSRHLPQPTDKPTKPWDHSEEEHNRLLGYSKPNDDDPEPLPFKEFKANIDTQGGYL